MPKNSAAEDREKHPSKMTLEEFVAAFPDADPAIHAQMVNQSLREMAAIEALDRQKKAKK